MKKIVFEIDNKGEQAAGILPSWDKITIEVSSGYPGGEPGEFEQYIKESLADWFDGARISQVMRKSRMITNTPDKMTTTEAPAHGVDVERLLVCPVCGGRAAYCDDGKENQRVDCCGDGKAETDGCGVGVWGLRSRAQARAIWNAIPRVI